MAAEIEAVRHSARSHVPDLYISALLAPPAARDDLVTLAAYLGEIARVPLTVSEPALAAIRLQWWRDAIETVEPGVQSGNPVADAFVEMIQRRGLPRQDVLAPLDAHDHMLSRGKLQEEMELSAYLDATATVPFRLAAIILGCKDPSELLPLAGGSYGRARLALDLPFHLARQRRPVPMSYFSGRDPRGLDELEARAVVMTATQNLVREAREFLASAKPAFASASPELQIAALPLALVEPYFRALQRPGRDALRQPADISPLNRCVRLWLARWQGKV